METRALVRIPPHAPSFSRDAGLLTPADTRAGTKGAFRRDSRPPPIELQVRPQRETAKSMFPLSLDGPVSGYTAGGTPENYRIRSGMVVDVFA